MKGLGWGGWVARGWHSSGDVEKGVILFVGACLGSRGCSGFDSKVLLWLSCGFEASFEPEKLNYLIRPRANYVSTP